MVDFEKDIKECVRVLQEGGLILYPTDTIWGIGCDATKRNAVEKIFTLKKRMAEKSVIVLLADAKDVLQYVAAPPPDVIALVDGFTQPTTVIYTHAVDLPDNVINADGSVAIRVTADPFCKALIKRFRKPIVSTSANISGGPAAMVYAEIDAAIIAGVDYVVAYKRDDTSRKAPSRLVRMGEAGIIEVIRP